MDIKEYQQYQPNSVFEGITFLTPNEQCLWRVQTLRTKEPDTYEWLHTMREGEILWDVGSNMGQYALIAAKQGVTVQAFEPESQNFALLCRNIGINNLGAQVTAWPLALSNKSGFDYFWAQSLQVGGSCSSYSEPVNYHLQPKKYAVRQGASAITGDEFADKYGFPTHVKIDVDGFEHKVIEGMGAVLVDVKSVLVEINTALAHHMRIYEIMEDHGLYPDNATADIARRKEGSFKGIGNVIFYRR